MVKFEEAIAILLKNGCTEVKELGILTATYVPGEEYDSISVKLDTKVKRYLPDENNVYSLSESYTIPLLLSSVVRWFEYNGFGSIAPHIKKHPTSLETILPNCSINVVLQEVQANASYIDPFSERNPEKENEEDFDRIFYIVSKIELTKDAEKKLEKIDDFLLFGAPSK